MNISYEDLQNLLKSGKMEPGRCVLSQEEIDNLLKDMGLMEPEEKSDSCLEKIHNDDEGLSQEEIDNILNEIRIP